MSMIIPPVLEEVQRKRRDLLTLNFGDQYIHVSVYLY